MYTARPGEEEQTREREREREAREEEEKRGSNLPSENEREEKKRRRPAWRSLGNLSASSFFLSPSSLELALTPLSLPLSLSPPYKTPPCDTKNNQKTTPNRNYPTSAEAYELLEECGRGVSATVWRARVVDPDSPHVNEDVAVKLMDLESAQLSLDEIVREAATMRAHSHPNVLPLLTSFVDAGARLWMVMPFVAGGSALNIMRFAFPDGLEEPVIAEDFTGYRRIAAALKTRIVGGESHFTRQDLRPFFEAPHPVPILQPDPMRGVVRDSAISTSSRVSQPS